MRLLKFVFIHLLLYLIFFLKLLSNLDMEGVTK
jgi:hypothetical protein